MGKVDTNKRLKRISILDAALELFIDKGLHETSVSEIAARSGVAKGTFYLYFKDKYDIRNKLIIYQSRRMLRAAYEAMLGENLNDLEDQLIFISNHVLDQLNARKDLLILISKNLSWGILKQELIGSPQDEEDFLFVEAFHGMTEPHGIHPPESEIMLYLLVELMGSACYNAILYEQPCSLSTLKPYLFETVRQIIRQFSKTPRETDAPVD